jgi:hypothetical protein
MFTVNKDIEAGFFLQFHCPADLSLRNSIECVAVDSAFLVIPQGFKHQPGTGP